MSKTELRFKDIYPILSRAYEKEDTEKIKRIKSLINQDNYPFDRNDLMHLASAYNDCVVQRNMLDLGRYIIGIMIRIGSNPNVAEGVSSKFVNEQIFLPYYAVYLDLCEREVFDPITQNKFKCDLKAGMLFSLEKMAHAIGHQYCNEQGYKYEHIKEDYMGKVYVHFLSKLDDYNEEMAKASTWFYVSFNGLISNVYNDQANHISATRHLLIRNTIRAVREEYTIQNRLHEIATEEALFDIVQDRLGPNKTKFETFRQVLLQYDRRQISFDIEPDDENNSDANVTRSLSTNTPSPEAAFILSEQQDTIENLLHTFPYVKWVAYCLYNELFDLLPDNILDVAADEKYRHAKNSYSSLRKADVIDILSRDIECVESAKKINLIINEANISKWTNELQIALNKLYVTFEPIPLTEEVLDYDDTDDFIQNLNTPPMKLSLMDLLSDYSLCRSVSYCLIYQHFKELNCLVNYPTELQSEIEQHSTELPFCMDFMNKYLAESIHNDGFTLTESLIKGWADDIFEELDIPAQQFEKTIADFQRLFVSNSEI